MINQRNITKSGFSRVNEVVSVAVVDDNEKIVQTAAKMAKVLDARFTAIYVQNDFALTESDQKKLDNNIQFIFRLSLFFLLLKF